MEGFVCAQEIAKCLRQGFDDRSIAPPVLRSWHKLCGSLPRSEAIIAYTARKSPFQAFAVNGAGAICVKMRACLTSGLVYGEQG
ncbi:hypothetical protein AWL63_20040 [Sphingomonas panacis]|uniref:Uncharacterized protein n=1 Tax=Sphingomonas panacis TaxID=1560345 RepID=A0A1B3ZET2_9SPHN|nr:hypothetical protein AWL63_20040 [Sphingomonas panacis]